MAKFALVDIETTGLNPNKHEIIEMGVIVFDSETHKVLQQLDMRIKPERPEDGDPKAYAVNGYNAEEWENCMSLKMAMELFSVWTQGATFLAYNVTFDWVFIQEAFNKTGVPNNMHYHRMCLMSMAHIKLIHTNIPGLRLKNVCQYLNIPPEPEVHRAIHGAQAAFEVYKELSK